MKITEITSSLHEVFDGQPWFGNSLSTYLQEVQAETLNFSVEGGNSIGQIIDHMVLWREFVLTKLSNVEEDRVNGISQKGIEDEDWFPNNYKNSDKNMLFAKIRATQKALILKLEESEDSLLSETVPGEKYNFEHLLQGIIHHDIYHLGQLYLLISAAKKVNENA